MSVSPKIIAATLAAACVSLVCWGASLAGVSVPVEVVGALTVIATFAAGYLKIDPARA